jgi:hypothetical protein
MANQNMRFYQNELTHFEEAFYQLINEQCDRERNIFEQQRQ